MPHIRCKTYSSDATRNNMMKIRSLGLALALGFVLPASQAAIPFVDQQLKFRQPDGNTLTIYLSGNNYFAEQRLADGKLVVYDNQLKGYAPCGWSVATALHCSPAAKLAVAPAGQQPNQSGFTAKPAATTRSVCQRQSCLGDTSTTTTVW